MNGCGLFDFERVFQHTATRRWLQIANLIQFSTLLFQHTATRRWLRQLQCEYLFYGFVSTHSHPKVAAFFIVSKVSAIACFNTQPPEGGCISTPSTKSDLSCFNTQPPEGGCTIIKFHSLLLKSFNTQPPEGGCVQVNLPLSMDCLFQHTATRRWLQLKHLRRHIKPKFQHTATRRWLRELIFGFSLFKVSTHSHPKVAAKMKLLDV